MRRLLFLAALVFLGVLGGCATSSGSSGPELRVTRAVLYQNGIGYFERRGKVKGDRVVIRIRPDQIADFLKSLTVVDLSEGGRAVSVALPVEKSQSRQMADLPPQVREQGGLLAIIAAFRGARAHVKGAEGSATGRIVGVEQVEVGAGDKRSQEWRLTLLDGSTLRTFVVGRIKSLKILDRTLTVGLDKALDVTLNEGAWKPIELSVAMTGRKAHDVVVSYVVEMPSWKPAYRVILGDSGKALLQGWAVVDNVSGEDWKDIQLSLTAGTPLAFQYDLYTPHYVRRPNLSPSGEPEGVAIDSRAYHGGAGRAAPPPSAAPAKPMPSRKEASRSRKPAAEAAPEMAEEEISMDEAPPPPPPVSEADLERNYRTLVAGAGVGSLFRYDLTTPISVRDRESALVNVVSTRVTGDDVMIFRVGIDQQSPYRAVRFKNETGFVLERGPVAIYRSSTFLGEALGARLEKNATAFVPYALDTRVQVFLEQSEAEEGMRLVMIRNGRIFAESKRVTHFIYEVANRGDEDATLYVQRPRRTGWTLTRVALVDAKDASAPPQPGKDGVVVEDNVYSVPIKLPKEGRVRIAVDEETPAKREVEILSPQGRQLLAVYLQSPDRDPKVAQKLEAAFQITERLGAIARRSEDLETQRRVLAEREQGVRDNLRQLRKTAANAETRRQQEVRLEELGKQLDAVTREIVQITEERSKLQDQLAAALKDVTLKTK